MIKDLSVMIAGKAGDGVLFTGNVLARLLKRHGWEVVTGRDFPSNIRGEPTRYTIRASLNENYGPGDLVNILLAFDCEAVLDNLPLMAAGGIVLCDGEVVVKPPRDQAEGKTFHKFPLRPMAKEEFGHEIFKNMIALGALNFLLDLETALFEEVITEMFLKQKGEEVVRKNIQAAAYGYEKAREITLETERHPLARKEGGERLLLSGDEAIAFVDLSVRRQELEKIMENFR
ncbi:MAG: 2-oxoacid:acceptor oxidoreductase family protein [Clostridiales bacterium]|jgi:2-oxoglutarate ferredoxin oxidoreductase subunit alpha|nr:2-oxoacid:acceptor oxidoreductase family protein [Clostridiales bacterium]